MYRNSARFFALFFVGLVVAFWPTYFARLFEQPSVFFHLHGVALTLWAVMLVAQAQLIRTGRRSLHRTLGKASYVLAPAVVAITASFDALSPARVERVLRLVLESAAVVAACVVAPRASVPRALAVRDRR